MRTTTHRIGLVHRGFTVVELMVVTGIAGFLAAMLMPTLLEARSAGGRIACGANMRQCLTALQNYLLDNNNHQPMFACYSAGNGVLRVKDYLYPPRLAMYLGHSGISDAPHNTAGYTSGPWWEYVNQVAGDGAVRRGPLFCPSEDYQRLPFNVLPMTGSPLWSCMLTSYGALQTGWDPRFVLGRGPAAIGVTGFASDIYACPGPGSAIIPEHLALGRTLASRPDAANTGVFGHLTGNHAAYLNINMAIHYENPRPGFPSSQEYNPSSYYLQVSPPGDVTGNPDPNNHRGRLPFGFLDGHVEYISARHIIDPDRYGPLSPTPLWYSP